MPSPRRKVLRFAARSHYVHIRNLDHGLSSHSASWDFRSGQTTGLNLAVATLFGVSEERAWITVRRMAFAMFYRKHPHYCCPTCRLPLGGSDCAQAGHDPVPAYQER